MRTGRRGREGGFTVLEVIVAGFLLTIGLIATAQLAIMATGQVALGRQASDASTLAAQTIEQYRDINFSKLLAGTSVTTPTVGATTYTVTTVVTNNDPQTSMTRVRVTVAWGGSQTYVAETILSTLQ
jgi:Tfp pilus assembly protein PilV